MNKPEMLVAYTVCHDNFTVQSYITA